MSETTKIILSSAEHFNIRLGEIHCGLKGYYSVERTMFEELNQKLFNKMMECVENAQKQAYMVPRAINDVVLVGGSTRIPKVKQVLKEFFGAEKVKEDINPDEAVALGAAILARKMLDYPNFKKCHLVDVSDSLGVGIVGDIMSVIIPKNTHSDSALYGLYDNQGPEKID